MWRVNQVGHKCSRPDNPEQLRLKRREQEKVLRQARRDRQLFSKRLLQSEDDHITEDLDVVILLERLQKSGAEKEATLKSLGRALRETSAQSSFIKVENSIHLLVGLLTGSNTECRLLAARCLHELSHSPHSAIALACLPATPYLLTYLSGQSTKFTELCLYTLGNLCPESDAVKEKLLFQGIVPALANCLETHIRNLALVEAIGFTLAQLLQGPKAAETFAPIILSSSLPCHLLSVLHRDSEFGLAPVIEVAWCLHYLISSAQDCGVLFSHGALSKCSSLLISLGGTVAEVKEEGLELLIWPLLRCVGNLLSFCPVEHQSTQDMDVGLAAALCAFLNVYLKTQPALAREAAWVLNNLTAHSLDFCSALLNLNLVPGLLQLLPFSQGINTMILRVLANIAHKKKDFSEQLVRLGLLSALNATLKMATTEIVVLSLEVLYLLIDSDSQVAEEFVKQGGLLMIEALQYNSERDLRQRASYLLEHKLSYST